MCISPPASSNSRSLTSRVVSAVTTTGELPARQWQLRARTLRRLASIVRTNPTEGHLVNAADTAITTHARRAMFAPLDLEDGGRPHDCDGRGVVHRSLLLDPEDAG